MKRTICILTIAIALQMTVFTGVKAQQGAFGLGVMVGEPTGVSMKIWLPGASAIDGGAAWSYFYKPSLHLHADYLFHIFNVIPTGGVGEMPLYFGVGTRFKVHANDEHPDIGIRAPAGISYIFANGALDTFTELVPIFNFFPATSIDFNMAIGLRYYF